MSRLTRYLRRLLGEPVPPEQPYTGATISGTFSDVSVGERVSFGGRVFIHARAPISIGSDVMIAAGTQILTATHDPENHPMWAEGVRRPVQIGNHVWIGNSAIILPGVKIGDYAIVAAGAVVHRHVPEAAVVGGVPAHILRYRDMERLLANPFENPNYRGQPRHESFLADDAVCKEAPKNGG